MLHESVWHVQKCAEMKAVFSNLNTSRMHWCQIVLEDTARHLNGCILVCENLAVKKGGVEGFTWRGVWYKCILAHTHTHACTCTHTHTHTHTHTSQQTVGVIVRLEKEAFKVLTQYGKEVNVPQHAIQPRKTRAVALDCRQVMLFKEYGLG